MSAPPFMPLFVADYLADTTHLTNTEHGTYFLLLLAMWRAGGTLPNDDRQLARYAKLTRAQWDRVRPTIMAFFDVTDTVITHSRLVAHLTRHSEVVEQRMAAGSNGGKAKALKDKAARLANASGLPCQPEPEPEEVGDKSPPSGAGAPGEGDDAIFTRLVDAYPGKPGRSPPAPARIEFNKLPADVCAKLPDCAVAYGLDAGWGSGGPPALHKWLRDRYFERFLNVRVARVPTWQGPPEIREHVAAALGEGGAVSYLDTATWQADPPAIFTVTQYAADQLRGLKLPYPISKTPEAA